METDIFLTLLESKDVSLDMKLKLKTQQLDRWEQKTVNKIKISNKGNGHETPPLNHFELWDHAWGIPKTSPISHQSPSTSSDYTPQDKTDISFDGQTGEKISMKYTLHKTNSGNWGLFYWKDRPTRQLVTTHCACTKCPGHTEATLVMVPEQVALYVDTLACNVISFAKNLGLTWSSE